MRSRADELALAAGLCLSRVSLSSNPGDVVCASGVIAPRFKRRFQCWKVLVAIANKHARQIWAILAHEVDYDPCAGVNHPMQPKAGSA